MGSFKCKDREERGEWKFDPSSEEHIVILPRKGWNTLSLAGLLWLTGVMIKAIMSGMAHLLSLPPVEVCKCVHCMCLDAVLHTCHIKGAVHSSVTHTSREERN